MGIIAGIAIPTTIAVINRQKKNAAVKSAQNVLSAAKTVLMEAASGESISYVTAGGDGDSFAYKVKISDLQAQGELETNPITDPADAFVAITSSNKFTTTDTSWKINDKDVNITINSTTGEWTFAVS